jgi:uncharacterized protein YmfQ (DUF2313 family)
MPPSQQREVGQALMAAPSGVERFENAFRAIQYRDERALEVYEAMQREQDPVRKAQLGNQWQEMMGMTARDMTDQYMRPSAQLAFWTFFALGHERGY